jgi:hypothetical protein
VRTSVPLVVVVLVELVVTPLVTTLVVSAVLVLHQVLVVRLLHEHLVVLVICKQQQPLAVVAVMGQTAQQILEVVGLMVLTVGQEQ